MPELTEGRWRQDRPNPVGVNFRTEFQRERDLEVITRLYLQRHYQYEIPALLRELTRETYLLSRQQITYDLEEVRSRWRESALINFAERTMEEVAKCDELEAAAWDSFRLSQKPRKITAAKSITLAQLPVEQRAALRLQGMAQGFILPVREETSAREETQLPGNPAFLAVIDRVARRRCELLRLIDVRQPKSIDQPGDGLDEAAVAAVDLSLEERARRAAVLMVAAVRRRDGLEPIPDQSSDKVQ